MIEKKLERHRKSLENHGFGMVVCVGCGSTRIDQNSTMQIKCYDCDNSLYWDSRRFTIRREPVGGEADVIIALRAAHKK